MYTTSLEAYYQYFGGQAEYRPNKFDIIGGFSNDLNWMQYREKAGGAETGLDSDDDFSELNEITGGDEPEYAPIAVIGGGRKRANPSFGSTMDVRLAEMFKDDDKHQTHGANESDQETNGASSRSDDANSHSDDANSRSDDEIPNSCPCAWSGGSDSVSESDHDDVGNEIDWGTSATQVTEPIDDSTIAMSGAILDETTGGCDDASSYNDDASSQRDDDSTNIMGLLW